MGRRGGLDELEKHLREDESGEGGTAEWLPGGKMGRLRGWRCGEEIRSPAVANCDSINPILFLSFYHLHHHPPPPHFPFYQKRQSRDGDGEAKATNCGPRLSLL